MGSVTNSILLQFHLKIAVEAEGENIIFPKWFKNREFCFTYILYPEN